MESFFLAETTKYLYLLFDPNNFIHNPGLRGVVVDTPNGKCVVNSGGYVFNTEAHPLDPSMIYCCDRRRQRHNEILSDFHDNIDILDLLGLSDNDADRFDLSVNELIDDVAVRDHRTTIDVTNNYSDVDIGYELDEQEETSDDDDAASTTVSHVVEATTTSKRPNKVLLPPESKNSNAKSNFTFADSVVKALAKVVDEWKNLLAAEKQLTDVVKLKSSDGYCRREDQISSSVTLNAMLNVVYSRNKNEDSFDAHASSSFLCDPADAPKEEEHYLRTIPDTEKLSAYDDDDIDIKLSVKKINVKSYHEYSSFGGYHFELMSCKARSFVSKLTGLGEVLVGN